MKSYSETFMSYLVHIPSPLPTIHSYEFESAHIIEKAVPAGPLTKISNLTIATLLGAILLLIVPLGPKKERYLSERTPATLKVSTYSSGRFPVVVFQYSGYRGIYLALPSSST